MADSTTADTKDARLLAKWEAVAGRYEELNTQLADPSVLSQPAMIKKLTKERADLEEPARLLAVYQALLKQLTDTEHLLNDPGVDPELQALATDEARRLQ